MVGPLLLVGGSGLVGAHAARYLRAAHPDVSLLIGGRDLGKAEKVAREVGGAEAVVIDMTAADLGLGSRAVGAVAVLFTDERLAGLRFAQARRVPYVSISPGFIEIGVEAAAHMHAPTASAVVLATEWLVGATTIPTLEIAKSFRRVDRITIGALLDEQDTTGPAGDADLERQTKTTSAALGWRDGGYFWRDTKSKPTFRAVDGTVTEAMAFSVYDVLGLQNATSAPNIEFNLAIGVSSSRRGGEPMSTEIILELEGESPSGEPRKTRHAVVHPQGQMPLTGLGVALLLERLVGLDGQTPVLPGLYFPYQLLEPSTYRARFDAIGGRILELDA